MPYVLRCSEDAEGSHCLSSVDRRVGLSALLSKRLLPITQTHTEHHFFTTSTLQHPNTDTHSHHKKPLPARDDTPLQTTDPLSRPIRPSNHPLTNRPSAQLSSTLLHPIHDDWPLMPGMTLDSNGLSIDSSHLSTLCLPFFARLLSNRRQCLAIPVYYRPSSEWMRFH